MQPNYRPAQELAQRTLRALDPDLVAAMSGTGLARRETGWEFHLAIMNKEYRVPMPEALVYDAARGVEAGVSTSLVVLHYLVTADGSPTRGEWIPFRSVPGGNVYERAFRRQCIDPLVSTFGNDPEALGRAAESLGGRKAEMGDLSYVLQALPRLPMACVLWLPDEEQGAEASLLFDAVAPHCLPTEDLAALGRMVAFGLVGARGRKG